MSDYNQTNRTYTIALEPRDKSMFKVIKSYNVITANRTCKHVHMYIDKDQFIKHCKSYNIKLTNDDWYLQITKLRMVALDTNNTRMFNLLKSGNWLSSYEDEHVHLTVDNIES